MSELSLIKRAAFELLDRNWREGSYRDSDYCFSVPSPRSYPWQWYWDSCKHAIVRARYDRARARAELETLLRASREDGFIGHTIFWHRAPSPAKAARYNVLRRSDLMTGTIQPPMLAWAWAAAVGEPRDEPRIAAHHDWLLSNRDLDGDGLIWLIQPDESGMDASPKFDHVWGSFAQGTPLFPLLVAANRRRGFDARRIANAGRPVICEVLSNVLWSLSQQALGQPSPTAALIARCYDERTGRFYDDVRNPSRELARERRPVTWDTLAPLALPDLPQAIGHRLVQETLLSDDFWHGVPLPSVALSSPASSSCERFFGFRRHWRGPSWVNSAWLVSLGLRRLHYDDLASDMSRRLCDVIAREGFREYYHTRSGDGMAAKQFGWTSLICELADPSPLAAQSYLPVRDASR